MYVIRLSYEPRAGLTGDAALNAAREFNRYWVALGMPQMRVLLSPFGSFGAPFVHLDVVVEDLAEAEAALTRVRGQIDPRAGASNPAPGVDILRIVDEPPIDEAQLTQTLHAASPLLARQMQATVAIDEATEAAARAQDASLE
jgi:hypothetical protein